MSGSEAPLSDRYLDALAMAADLHRFQVRKSTKVPYLTHLMSVSALVWEAGGDEDTAIAGLLHDAYEDAGGPAALEQITERFGSRVAVMVAACSEPGTGTGPKAPWRDRKDGYLAHLGGIDDRSVLLVAVADKLHNCRSLVADIDREGLAVFDRFNASPADTVWFYRSVVEVVVDKLPAEPLVTELAASVERLAGLLS